MSTLDDFSLYRECKIDEIYETWCVLDILTSNLSFSTPEILMTQNRITEINGVPVFSAQNTLISIDFCVQKGFFSDAFVLTRKYRDDLMLCLYLFYKVLDIGKESDTNLDNIFANFSESDFYDWFEKSLKKAIENNTSDKDKIVLQNWQSDKYLGNSPSKAEASKIFDAKNYSKTFKNKDMLPDERAEKIKQTYEFIEPCWKTLSQHLNDYVHVNSIKTLKNNVFLTQEQKLKLSNDLFDTLQKITVSFLALLAMIRPSSLTSNDYVFTYEITGKWEDGLQYEIPSGIADYFEKYTSKVNPQLLQYIHNNNLFGMRIIHSKP